MYTRVATTIENDKMAMDSVTEPQNEAKVWSWLDAFLLPEKWRNAALLTENEETVTVKTSSKTEQMETTATKKWPLIKARIGIQPYMVP